MLPTCVMRHIGIRGVKGQCDFLPLGAAFVRGEPDLDPETHNDAKWLLDFYDTFKEFNSRDVTDTALRSLSQVSFILPVSCH